MGQLYRCETSTSQNSCYSIFSMLSKYLISWAYFFVTFILQIPVMFLFEKSIPMICWFQIKKVKRTVTQNLASANHGCYKHMVGLKTVLLSMCVVDRLPVLYNGMTVLAERRCQPIKVFLATTKNSVQCCYRQSFVLMIPMVHLWYNMPL